MNKKSWLGIIAATGIVVGTILASCGSDDGDTRRAEDSSRANALQMFEEGKQTFRFATFGDESFWGDTLKLHQAIQGSNFGGVGAGVSPKTALAVGLKVDVDALPQELVSQLKNGSLNLDDPANTLALIKLNAVLGITGFFNPNGSMKSIGIQCAFCHSTVDNSLAPGIGHRLDGWANRDLDVGTIVNLSPDLSAVATLLGVDEATVREVLKGWGPGRFDAQLFLDGKAAKPGGTLGSAAILIPPAFGLAGVNLHTSTGWGSVTYWNAFVANLEMHGKGTFFDSRLNDPVKFPVAARVGSGNTRPSSPDQDLITPKLPALQFYQLAIAAPPAPAGSFDQAAAARGKVLFEGKAKCATCHVPPLFTEPGWNMHTPAEIGLTAPGDDFQAKRSPDERYRTTPLKGLWTHTKGGFYHDGRFATLLDVVNHYNANLPPAPLGLTAAEANDLVEYLKSL
jgi:mono/diheme cytochrome c family protein